MNVPVAGWTPDPFATGFDRRDDGSLILRPLGELASTPPRFIDYLRHWAGVAPDRVLVARRVAGGEWREVSYAQMLARVQRLAAGLLTRGLSAERPLTILSGNSIEHLTLALAAIWAGIPYCPVSPAYSQVAGELSRLRYALELLTPGLVAAFDTPRFERALTRVGEDMEIVGDAPVVGRAVTTLDSLEGEVTPAVMAAPSATDENSIVRFLLTSGSTGNPKAVITTNRQRI